MKTIKISDKAYSIIEEKCELNKMSKRAAAEHMIMDFSKSSPKEIIEQKEAKAAAYKKFVAKYPKADSYQLWSSGYRFGWLHFQIRKFLSPLRP